MPEGYAPTIVIMVSRCKGREGKTMPLSVQARTGLRAAVEWNPRGGKMLRDLLRDTPELVRYKNDHHGPLGLLLYGTDTTKWITKGKTTLPSGVELGEIVPRRPAPFPKDKLEACEVFGREWLARRFTKAELVQAIDEILQGSRLS